MTITAYVALGLVAVILVAIVIKIITTPNRKDKTHRKTGKHERPKE